MPLPLDTATRNALRAGNVAHAWLLELFPDEGALRCWDKVEPITFETNVFEATENRWGIDGTVSGGANLVSQPMNIWFDGGGALDDTSFIGRLLDSTWHERAIRLRQLLLVPDGAFATVIGAALDWVGFMDQITDPEGGSGDYNITLKCESGTFRARGQNLHTITDKDQRLFDPDDGSFANIGLKPLQQIPFGVSWSDVPGVAASSGSATGGGSTGGNRFGGANSL